MSGIIGDHVSVAITAAVAKVAKATFALPLLVSHSAAWTDGLIREYAKAADVALDFAVTTPEYRQAGALFAQNPAPAKLLIGMAPNKPTQRWAVTPTAVNSYTYRMTITGTDAVAHDVSFTADSSATVTEVIAGLKAAIDALALAITVTDQTTFMRIVANTAGAFFSVKVTSGNLALAQDHADPGIATDLAALLAERSDWFGLLTHFNSSAYVQAAAAWALTNKKQYIFQTQDSAIPNTALSGTDDVGEILKAAGNNYAVPVYSPDTDDFADAAAVGRCFPALPGSLTWKFKTLAGVPVTTFTSTQRTNLKSKNVNFYEEVSGVSMLAEGVTSSGSFIDLETFVQYLTARLGERAFGVLARNDKVPMNDRGIGLIVAELRAQFASEEAREAILPGWTVTAPKAADISANDRANRDLTDVEFSATYASPTHHVTITGVLSV